MEQLASQWQDAAMLMIEAALKLDQTDAEQDSWQGRAADAFRSALNTHRTTIGKLRASYEDNADTLNRWAGQLRGLQELARTLERRASQAEDEIHAGILKEAHGMPLSPADQRTLDGHQSDFASAQQQAEQLHQDYLQAARLIAHKIDGALNLPSGNRGWYGQSLDQQQETALLGAEEHRKGGAVPEDEEERLLWWQQLPAQMQQQLIQQEPQDIGNANGLPAQARSDANMIQLNQALQDAKSRNDKARITALQQIMEAMTNSKDTHHRTPMFLLGFSQEGNGRAIVCYGNPDAATNTAVYVPGTGTSLDDMQGDIGRACTMFDSSNRESPGTTASMVWLGYTAPQWLTGPAEGRYADMGAPQLADFVNSLSLTHQGSSHVTVIGHSYGSTVVGAALGHYGMHADDAVFVGSPGVTVDHAADLHMDPSHVWAGHMQNDVVPSSSLPASADPAKYLDDYSERYGTDPVSREFGGRAFASGYGQGDPASSHSDYWNAGSLSLSNMTHIVTGNYEFVSAPSNMERDGNESTNPIGYMLQYPGWEITNGAHHFGGTFGDEMQHAGQAISQTGHGVGADIGALFDVATGDPVGAADQVGDAEHDERGVISDTGHMLTDPFEGS
ncbi:MAG: hypothetical protein JO362_21480 [Streptomycetaceae bacterium]|nr:hypothetical protein [Streptomycetaceae bacterium]